MNKKKTIPTILGIFVLMLGVATGVFLLQRQQMFRLGASGGTEPKDVRITNVTDTSFTVSWVTDKQTVGAVEWGTSQNMDQTAHEDNGQTTIIHTVTLKHLNPNTKHYFQILSGNNEYTQTGSPWQVTTGSQLAPPETSNIISGQIQTQDGAGASGVLVYATVGSALPLSTTTSQNGEWVISLANARNQSVSNYANLTPETLVELYIQGGSMGVASAQTLLKNANPTQTIALGNSYDFKNETRDVANENPQAELSLPDETNDRESGFNLTNEDVEGSDEEVTIESIDNNEIVYTQKPEFFGSGPTGTEFTITVESEPISDQVTVNSSGWSWSPPNNLEEGEHTLTISWTDAQGILRKITRTFVVQAAEDEPSFESTPSDTTTPTTTPTPTATPTITPTATSKSTATPKPTAFASATPTGSPRTSITASDSAEIPEAGSVRQTILLAISGFCLLTTGIYVSIKKT